MLGYLGFLNRKLIHGIAEFGTQPEATLKIVVNFLESLERNEKI